jgi:cathepsin L
MCYLLDWRKKGAVIAVIENQEQCGSCWAFTANCALEGQHFIKTGQLVRLSAQNLIDCSGKFGNQGCNGGLMDAAFQYIQANKGIDTAASYPYEAKNGNCRFNPAHVGATDTVGFFLYYTGLSIYLL